MADVSTEAACSLFAAVTFATRPIADAISPVLAETSSTEALFSSDTAARPDMASPTLWLRSRRASATLIREDAAVAALSEAVVMELSV